MSVVHVDPKLLAQLEQARLPVVTGRARWVLLELRGIVYQCAVAAGFVLEPTQGMAGVDFDLPENKSALQALIKHLERRHLLS